MIREIHKLVSSIPTPKEYIDTDENGIEYPKTHYMRAIAQKYYKILRWNIAKVDIVHEDGKPSWIVVHGRLVWSESDDIIREGDMIASHRVQYSKKSGKILDLSNDIKAANTDTFKKALNFYLNVCDDVYRWEDPELTDKQKDELLEVAPEDKKESIKQAIETFKINKANYKLFLRALNNN